MILLMSYFRMEKNEAWTTMYKYITKNLQLRDSTTRYLLQNLTLDFSSTPKDFVCALMEVNWSLMTKAPANVTFINKYLLHLGYVDEDHILCASNLPFYHVFGFWLKRWAPLCHLSKHRFSELMDFPDSVSMSFLCLCSLRLALHRPVFWPWVSIEDILISWLN